MERRRHYNRNPEASPLAPRRNALPCSQCCSLPCDLNHVCKTWHCCKCCSCQHGANAGRGERQGELLRPEESQTKNPSLKTKMTWRQSTQQRWLMTGKWVTASRLGSQISTNQPLSHKHMEKASPATCAPLTQNAQWKALLFSLTLEQGCQPPSYGTAFLLMFCLASVPTDTLPWQTLAVRLASLHASHGASSQWHARQHHTPKQGVFSRSKWWPHTTQGSKTESSLQKTPLNTAEAQSRL